MIGIRKHDSAIELLHLLASDPFHGPLGAHRHIDRREHLPMRQSHRQSPCEPTLILHIALKGSFLLLDFLLESVVLIDICCHVFILSYKIIKKGRVEALQ